MRCEYGICVYGAGLRTEGQSTWPHFPVGQIHAGPVATRSRPFCAPYDTGLQILHSDLALHWISDGALQTSTAADRLSLTGCQLLKS